MLKPAVGWFETPKVRPAEGLMPGLLKLKPEPLLLPKPRKVRARERTCVTKERTTTLKYINIKSLENLNMATGPLSTCGQDVLNNITDEYERAPMQTVPALILPPVGLLAEEKAKDDPPAPTPPNPAPPPKPAGESDTVKSVLSHSRGRRYARNTSEARPKGARQAQTSTQAI